MSRSAETAISSSPSGDASAASGIITTVAGSGAEHSSTGDGGPALEATLVPVHFEVDDRGRLFCDVEGNSVRMIDEEGLITTVLDGAEHGVQPYDVALVDERLIATRS